MKKMIEGKMYNTEAAKLVVVWDNGLLPGDINRCKEALYRNIRGTYFLHGAGGANTRYNTRVNGSWTSGEEIIPMSLGAAQTWVKNKLSRDEYVSIFDDPVNGGDKITKTLSITAAANRRLEQMQSQQGKSQSAIVEGLLLGEEG